MDDEGAGGAQQALVREEPPASKIAAETDVRAPRRTFRRGDDAHVATCARNVSRSFLWSARLFFNSFQNELARSSCHRRAGKRGRVFCLDFRAHGLRSAHAGTSRAWRTHQRPRRTLLNATDAMLRSFVQLAPLLAAAVLIWRQRHIISTFREAGATDAARARSLEELGIRRGAVLRRLRRHGVLVDTGGGEITWTKRLTRIDARSGVRWSGSCWSPSSSSRSSWFTGSLERRPGVARTRVARALCPCAAQFCRQGRLGIVWIKNSSTAIGFLSSMDFSRTNNALHSLQRANRQGTTKRRSPRPMGS